MQPLAYGFAARQMVVGYLLPSGQLEIGSNFHTDCKEVGKGVRLTMKATYRNGKGSASHNDRNYLSATKQDKEEVISKWQLFKECDSFHDNEIKAYEQLYGEWLKNRNDKLIKDGHPERCMTIADLVGKPNEEKRKGRYEVNETILQLGKNGDNIPIETLCDCVNQFVGMTKQMYGSNMEWLDIAVHFENSSVGHAHLRRTWFSFDEEGRAYPAKKQALKDLGFDVRADDDRRHNATVRQTEAERALWYQICKEHGIDLEEEPDLDNIKHMHPKEYAKAQDDKQKAIQLIETQTKAEIEQARQDWELIKEYEERKAREKYSKAFDNQSLDDVIQDMNAGR